jgi:caa(3)-type oxidase subunit IV
MRTATWAVLVGLSVASVLHGQINVAIGLAAIKAVVLGLWFMELKDAARVHAAAYVGGVALLAVVLALVA